MRTPRRPLDVLEGRDVEFSSHETSGWIWKGTSESYERQFFDRDALGRDPRPVVHPPKSRLVAVVNEQFVSMTCEIAKQTCNSEGNS